MNKLRKFFDSTPGRVLIFVLALLPAAAAFGLSVYYILGPGEGYFHSDCSDSLYWANASYEAGRVFDPTYRYAALLPFSASMWMTPLIAVFGFGITAHNVGMVIFALLFALSVWFCCRSMKMGTGWCSAAVCAVFLLLSSSDKLREILWGHTIYYSVGLCVFFTALGLCLRLEETLGAETEKSRLHGTLLWGALLLLLCAGAAADGAQVIAIGTLPVLGAVCAERLFCGCDRLNSRRLTPAAGALAAISAGTVAGIVLLAIFKRDGISAGYADAYSGWSELGAWVDNLLAFPEEYFSLLGVTVQRNATLFSAESLPAMLRVGCGLILIAAPLFMLIFYRHLSGKGPRMLVIGHFVLTAAILFGFICGKLSSANWRLTPIVGSSVLVTVTAARELCFAGRKLREAQPDAEPDDEEQPAARGRVLGRVGALLCAVLMLTSAISAKEIRKMPADYGRDNDLHLLARLLTDEGLEYGYATFWNCQTITVISESRAKVREVLADRSRGVYTDLYQSSRRWYTDQDYDKFFVLLSDSEYAAVSGTESWKDWMAQYFIRDYLPDNDDGLGVEGYRIYVFSVNVLDLE